MSLQAAILECDSEEEPLKPTDRQAINHKIKKLQDLKDKLRSCCSSHQQRCKIFIYESSMPKDMTCARMRKYIELRDKL